MVRISKSNTLPVQHARHRNMKVLERTLDETKTQKEYKRVLWIYDIWGWLTERKAAGKAVQLAGIQNGDVILDVACGTGTLLETIVLLNPDGKNIGIDLSPDMLNKANKRLQALNRGNLELREGNTLKLDFADNTFDILFNNYMVDLLPVEVFENVAAEFYRVLKPNGLIVLTSFSFGTRQIHKCWYWIAKLFPDLLTGCRPVSFSNYLTGAGFTLEYTIEVSQNTFPSQVIRARKMA